jgi:hypothetical protein
MVWARATVAALHIVGVFLEPGRVVTVPALVVVILRDAVVGHTGASSAVTVAMNTSQ